MVLESTLSYLDALHQNIDPNTGNSLSTDSIFTNAHVKSAIEQLRSVIEHETHLVQSVHLTDNALHTICTKLQALSYKITPTQLLHICRGSRRIVAPELKALEAFGKYRVQHSKTFLEAFIEDFSQRHSSYFVATSLAKKQKIETDYQKESFFEDAPFDELSLEKATTLAAEVAAIEHPEVTVGPTTFKAVARLKHPRAYTPWTRAERALLLEAMCYTNKLVRLSSVFGRSEKAIRKEGQKLIWKSRQKLK